MVGNTDPETTGETDTAVAGSTDSHVRSWGEVLDPRTMATHQQLGLAGIALLFVLPFVVRQITVLHIAGALFFATFVMSWDFVSGYTGEISFGHGLFFGVGGYAAGMANIHLGISPWPAVLIGIVAAGITGLLIGFPSLRLQGPYFSLVTLVTPVILISVFRFFPNLTGGELGLVSVDTVDKFGGFGPLPSLGFSPVGAYYLALAVFLVGLVLFVAITRSDAGIVLTGIREDETAIAATGKNPAKFKLFAFVLSGLVGGLAGATYGFSAVGSFTVSELLALVISIEVIIAAILGGMGTITGAAIGGLVFHLLRTWMRNFIGDLYFLIFAVVTLGFLFFLPRGIVPAIVGYVFDDDPAGEEGVVTDGGRSPLGRTLYRFQLALRRLGGDER